MVRVIINDDEWEDLQYKLDAIIKSNWRAANVIQEEASTTVGEQKSLARVRTGYLRDNIVSTPRGDGARIESRAPYSGYLEFGTRFMRPAPFFVAPLQRMLERIGKRYKTIWQRA